MARCIVLLAFGGSLDGCGSLRSMGKTVGPEYKPPPEASGEVSPPISSADDSAFSSRDLPGSWWRLYRDDILDTLVNEALTANVDLRVAAARLEQARAVMQEANVAVLPRVRASASITRLRPSGAAEGLDQELPNMTAYDLGLSAAYQFDLFGRIRRTLEAVEADTAAVRAVVDATRVTIVAETARAYADVCVGGMQLDVARRTIRLQEESLGLTERLQAAGEVGKLDVTRSRAFLAQARTAVPALETKRHVALFRLAVLTGRSPAEAPRSLLQCSTPPRLASTIPVGDGAALLRRRPDVRAAERRLAGATARIGVATADLYPTVTLGASAGTSALALGDLVSAPALRFGLGPLIQFTLPNTSGARARIAQMEAAAVGALADFDRTVLRALMEVETALLAYANELERNAELRQVRDQTAQALDLAGQLRAAGAAGSLDVLDAERSLAGAESALASSEGLLSTYQIAIFQALGGGWEAEHDTES